MTKNSELYNNTFQVQNNIVIKVKLVTVVNGNSKGLFSLATTQRWKERRYSLSGIIPLYP